MLKRGCFSADNVYTTTKMWLRNYGTLMLMTLAMGTSYPVASIGVKLLPWMPAGPKVHLKTFRRGYDVKARLRIGNLRTSVVIWRTVHPLF